MPNIESPRRPHLLLVEDELLMRNASARMLVTHYALTAVDSGEEALACLRAENVDIVLTDYRLPSITGIELLERIRARSPRVRRVLMSAGRVPDLDTYVKVGLVHAFLSKPLAPHSTLAALTRIDEANGF